MFRLPIESTHNKQRHYFFALAIIALFYILGNLPFVAIGASVNGDINAMIKLAQDQYGKTGTLVLMILPWILVFLSFFIIAKYIFKVPVKTFFTAREKFDWKRFWKAFGFWFILSTLLFLIKFNEQLTWQFSFEKFALLALVSSVVLFMQCTAEELVFRSFLLKWIGKGSASALVQVLTTGAVFGLMHASNPEVEALGPAAFIFYIGTGIFLGLLVVMDDGLELSSGFHFANNLFAAIIVTSNWQVFQTDALFIDHNPPSFSWLDVLLMLGAQVQFYFTFKYMYRWSSLKEKLFAK